MRLSVFVLVRNESGQILLQKRMNTGYLDGYWDFPSGHVEPEESIHYTAVRELMEEVGIEVTVSHIHLTHIDQYFHDKKYVNFVFNAQSWQGTPKIGEPEKVSELGWFDIDTLPENCVNMIRVVEQTGFSDQLTFSMTTSQSLADMGLPI